MKNQTDAQTEAVRITLIGMALDLSLGLGKIVGGVMSASFALVADGVHSLTDAVTDIFVLIIARTAYAAPDRGHPYGHGRFEAVGTIVMGVVFFITAAVLLYDASQRLAAVDQLAVPGDFHRQQRVDLQIHVGNRAATQFESSPCQRMAQQK